MSKSRDLDVHEVAPKSVRDLFKFYQKLPRDHLDNDDGVVDLRRGLNPEQQAIFHLAGFIPRNSIDTAYTHLGTHVPSEIAGSPADVRVYEVDNLPGESSNQTLCFCP